MNRLRRLAVGFAALATMLVAPAAAGAVDYAHPNTPGAPLSVPQDKLDAALECSAGVVGASRTPVLLLHGTGSSSHHNWSWNYERILNISGVPWCDIDMPDHANGDVQINGEYAVNGIRRMFASAGRRIAIFGHSQGGMLPRWALRWWPDTRAMVDDVVGFAPSNHGTTMAAATCNPECSASTWQQRNDSNFIAALNSFQETFPGISYTQIYTHTDFIVTPNSDDTGSSSLHGGGGAITNVATQDICPLDVYEHLAVGTIDPVAYALAVDALENGGPADPSRIPSSVCLQVLMPGVNPLTFPTDVAAALIDLETSPSTDIPAEPPLACYVTASCPGQRAAAESPYTGLSRKAKPKCKRKRRRARRGAQKAKRRACKPKRKRR